MQCFLRGTIISDKLERVNDGSHVLLTSSASSY